MNNQQISSEDSTRICNHMNNEHNDALIAYAKYYGEIEQPCNVKMLEINSRSMSLNVDGERINIHFDHVLENSADAHQTLVKMIKLVSK